MTRQGGLQPGFQSRWLSVRFAEPMLLEVSLHGDCNGDVPDIEKAIGCLRPFPGVRCAVLVARGGLYASRALDVAAQLIRISDLTAIGIVTDSPVAHGMRSFLALFRPRVRLFRDRESALIWVRVQLAPGQDDLDRLQRP